MFASSAIPVRRAEILATATFRFQVALAVQLTVLVIGIHRGYRDSANTLKSALNSALKSPPDLWFQ